MIIKIYCEFLYVILDYHSILEKKEKLFEIFLPFLIGIASCIYTIFSKNIQYQFINGIIPFIGTLLGFTLAALTLLLSNERIEHKTLNYQTKRKVRRKTVSMYKMLVINYSYLIIIETFLCVIYYIASLFQNLTSGIYNEIANSIFIMLVFHVLLGTVRTVTNLYFV